MSPDFTAFNHAIRDVAERHVKLHPDADPRAVASALIYNAALLAKKDCNKEDFLMLAARTWNVMVEQSGDASPLILPWDA